MAIEIEHKFLLATDAWRPLVVGRQRFIQGYIASGAAAVRVRVIDDGEARLTLKSASDGPARSEFEYPIPVEDARAILALPGVVHVAKVRHRVPAGPHTWEIDVFEGENAGLVLAEIELTREGEAFERPDWLGDDVTSDGRYYSAALARTPYRSWPVPAAG